jgi:hypothetical protein
VQIAEVTGDDSVLEPSIHPAEQEIKDCINEIITQYPLTEEEVVQDEVESAEVLHQSEEIIEDSNEAEEVPFDIDADDDAVLDSLLTPIAPCAAHDAETEREIQQENLEDIFPQEVKVEHVQLNETTVAAVVVNEVAEDLDDVFAEADNFDLDFTDDTEEDKDSIPDFF